ncbi:transcriptional regulator [Brumimicrobium salinarum]|uniref:Transcriptional regulator n=1 Tax=Brumimicrobium salinarum TaxID=2058658 RepID=A0A2I0R085_9FLAO|nr:transcriptional regulator [Brumimicrobium salinarum]PKR79977.1 transcriptional regulator [Brumimicrobium salinarum]
MEYIMNNYEWIFSGIGVALIGWIIIAFTKSKNKKTNKTNQTNNNVITINNGNTSHSESTQHSKSKDLQRKEDYRILFIDDNHTDFKMVSILKKAGWTNTKAIKDLTDLDDIKAREASIIFVDINGVGTQMFEDQGLGLAAALKNKYPKKTIILYSAEPTGDRFDKKLKKVDDSLPKNAEPYEFISLIEQYSNIS